MELVALDPKTLVLLDEYQYKTGRKRAKKHLTELTQSANVELSNLSKTLQSIERNTD